ncbi:MAG: SulP family inorganic anion transporter [Bryobacteraceae bacterium]
MRVRWNYSFRQFTGDTFGGAIAALIALPYGLAMASLMGLPPVLGLFTSLLTAPITALLGRNPVLIGGPQVLRFRSLRWLYRLRVSEAPKSV